MTVEGRQSGVCWAQPNNVSNMKKMMNMMSMLSSDASHLTQYSDARHLTQYSVIM